MNKESQKEESKFISGIRNKDHSAYNEFMKRYNKLILFVCRSRCRNNENAEELCNDITLKIFSKINLFDPAKGNFATWIGRIANNYLMDNIRVNDRNEEDVSIEEYFNADIEDDDHPPLNYNIKEYENNEVELKNIQVSEPFPEYNANSGINIINQNDNPKIRCLLNAMNRLSERDQLIVRLWADRHDNKEVMELLGMNYKALITAREGL